MRCNHVLFIDDIVLIDETTNGLNSKLQQWRHALECRGFRLSISKIEYLKCGIYGEEAGVEEVTMDGVPIPRARKLWHLGLIIEEKGDINKVINQRIRAG